MFAPASAISRRSQRRDEHSVSSLDGGVIGLAIIPRGGDPPFALPGG